MLKLKWYYVFLVFLSLGMIACDNEDHEKKIQYGGNVWDVVELFPQLSTAQTAVEKAELVTALQDPTAKMTLFAPVDDAFAALPDGVLDALLADPTGALKQVLLYHVVKGEYTESMLTNGLLLTTLKGDKLKITRSGNQILVNGSPLSAPVYVRNGVVYLIEDVLIPDDAD